MRMDDRKILDWAINKIQTDFKNDVALLIGHGFDKIEDDETGCLLRQFKGEFDYFIPESTRAYKLSKSFIVNGVGYDLYPRDWNSITSMAELLDCHTGCLADANVLYARSEEDRSRFEAMRKRLFHNLGDRRFVYRRAMDRFNMAMDIYQTMVFSEKESEVRMSAGFILDYLAQGVAFINGSYFKRGPLYQLEEMERFQKIPPSFREDYCAVLRGGTVVELKKRCHHIIQHTGKFLDRQKPPAEARREPDFRGLADWYQEMGHTWKKIYSGCRMGDAPRVFFWGCSLQHELDIIREEFGLRDMELLDAYDADDLTRICERAQRLEKYITDTIVQNSVSIAIYPNVESFLAEN